MGGSKIPKAALECIVCLSNFPERFLTFGFQNYATICLCLLCLAGVRRIESWLLFLCTLEPRRVAVDAEGLGKPSDLCNAWRASALALLFSCALGGALTAAQNLCACTSWWVVWATDYDNTQLKHCRLHLCFVVVCDIWVLSPAFRWRLRLRPPASDAMVVRMDDGIVTTTAKLIHSGNGAPQSRSRWEDDGGVLIKIN